MTKRNRATRTPKASATIMVFDAHGNDVTARAVIPATPAPPVPVQPNNEPEEFDAVYGLKIALRRQMRLRTLGARVWWYTGVAKIVSC